MGKEENMSLLVIFYWVLLLLVAIGAVAPASWEYWPRASAIITLILFIIIGIKLLKPTW
jgi:amino acid permease